jgi:sugar phosphate permease
MTVMFFMSTFFIAFLPHIGTATTRGANALNDIKEGLKYVRHEIVIILILANVFMASMFAMPYMQLLPIFTEDILKVGASGLGILSSASGVSGIVASLVLASLPNKKRGLMLILTLVITGCTLTLFSFSSSWPLSLVMMVIIGSQNTLGLTLSIALIQHYADPAYQGRVISIHNMQMGVSSFGTFVAGMLAESIGVQWTLGGFAMTLILLSSCTLVFFHQLRRLD